VHTVSIREPAVAGTFYPADANVLAAMVDAHLAGGRDGTALPPVRVLVAPHAGYAYSGAIASVGFRRLRSATSTLRRAFVIGPSHVEAFAFTSVFDGECYRTPLGRVAVDEHAARELANLHTSIRCDRAGHVPKRAGRGEHAIEVELPFLQRVTRDVNIVPITMGSQSWEVCEALGGALRRIIDWKHDVVIVSTDLSHFHDDTRARELDGVFCESIMTGDAGLLFGRLARGECEACGGGPMVAALLACDGLGARTCAVLASGNSGSVNQGHSSVVGYTTAVITGDPA
jgi:AmmeMemoRadiSam system protein B